MLFEKTCTHCKKVKTLDLFGLEKRRPKGKNSWCKECVKEASKKWRSENPDKDKEAKGKWYYRNLERVKENKKKYYIENRSKVDAAKEKWKKNNPEKVRAILNKYRKKNPDKVKESQKKSNKKRYSTLRGKINSNLSSSIYKTLHKGTKAGRHWAMLVGYTTDQLKTHLEKQFKDGMSWERFMNGEIHIDHKIPKSIFNFEQPTDIDFKRCWALSNLQPIWAHDNQVKYNNIDKPFQPALLLSEVA